MRTHGISGGVSSTTLNLLWLTQLQAATRPWSILLAQHCERILCRAPQNFLVAATLFTVLYPSSPLFNSRTTASSSALLAVPQNRSSSTTSIVALCKEKGVRPPSLKASLRYPTTLWPPPYPSSALSSRSHFSWTHNMLSSRVQTPMPKRDRFPSPCCAIAKHTTPKSLALPIISSSPLCSHRQIPNLARMVQLALLWAAWRCSERGRRMYGAQEFSVDIPGNNPQPTLLIPEDDAELLEAMGLTAGLDEIIVQQGHKTLGRYFFASGTRSPTTTIVDSLEQFLELLRASERVFV
ncbi:hypothetical protein DFH06DRAFT_1306258 [Mycena polygramma]|nr:hypothetical protein DFH06DRAFT_1306258 [Mycena polygramma]